MTGAMFVQLMSSDLITLLMHTCGHAGLSCLHPSRHHSMPSSSSHIDND
jgi:hypothetical protein